MDMSVWRYSQTGEWLPQRTDQVDEILVRTFPVELAGDGRTLEALCVPYGVRAEVADPPTFEPYMEEFLPGSFKGATKAPNRVLLDFEHQTSIGNVLGHGVELEERTDGLYGKFRVTEHADGDKALGLIRDKVLTGMSVMFKPLRSQRAGDVVQRLKAHLDRVSLCRVGAYPQAQVLAVRAKPLPRAEPLDAELVEKLKAKGFRIPGDTA